MNLKHFYNLILLQALCFSCASQEKLDRLGSTDSKKLDYIRPIEGKDELLDLELVKKGKVLISYGDCNSCHKYEKRAKGPSYQDIAKRYPRSQVYIDLLAQKVISGGKGSWGNSVMSPHPNLLESDAKAMVIYILSLDK